MKDPGTSPSLVQALDFLGVYRDIIPDFRGFMEALRGEIPTSFRVNTLLADPDKVIKALESQGIPLQATPLGEWFWLAPTLRSPGHLLEHLMGLIYTQTLSSGLPPLALDPAPTDRILDLCAAPGSKTTQMAQMMANRGLIVANEPVQGRHAALEGNLRRLGVVNTLVTGYHGQNFPLRWRFNKVLVDVPCSGEGNARVGPWGELRGFRPMRRDFSRLQKALLVRAFDLLEEGGSLVYSTCTYNPRENEAVVDHLLRLRPAEVLPIPLDVPHEAGLTHWRGETYHESLRLAWRIYPHSLPSVGFFMAKIARR
jgi:NOL1/NOP2/sun family putative RNA methylase